MPAGLENLVITFVLVVFRIGGMMLFAPLLGSVRIPRRVRVLFALVLAMWVTSTTKVASDMPRDLAVLTVGIGGEMLFGLAMGMIMSLVFIAAQWAGEIIGQQVGFNIGESFDPSMGGQGSVVGDLYYMMTLAIFLGVNGHHAMLLGVRESFHALPLLSVSVNGPLLGVLTGLMSASMQLAMQLAAPVLVTILVADLALGLIGRAMPQLNIMSAGLSFKSIAGLIIVIAGLAGTSGVVASAITNAMENVRDGWAGLASR